MVIHNATKVLPLSHQTKLTLTVTLTLTDTVNVDNHEKVIREFL